MATKKLGLVSFNVGTTIVVNQFQSTEPLEGDIDSVPKLDPRNVFLAFGINDNTGSPILNDDQINKLLSLEKPIGNKLFDFERQENRPRTLVLLGEFGQLLGEKGFDIAYSELLSFCQSLEKDFTWESTSLDVEKARVDFINEMEIKVEARDNIGICNKCQSKWITQSQIQNRASDEALKTTYKCAKCKAGKHYLTIF